MNCLLEGQCHLRAHLVLKAHVLISPLHRQLAEVVRERYLSGPEKAKRHGALADFFLGAWSQGTKKLITLPLVGKPLNLDRKVSGPHPFSPPAPSTLLCRQDQGCLAGPPSSSLPTFSSKTPS